MDSELNLYTTKQICQKIPWVTPRILIDLVEKEVISPAIPSSGTGQHRLYNKDNLLEIMVAVILRGYRPKDMVLTLILKLKGKVDKKEIEEIGLIVITKPKAETPVFRFLKKGDDIPADMLESSRELMNFGGTIYPGLEHVADSYSFIVIDVGGMQEFINKTF